MMLKKNKSKRKRCVIKIIDSYLIKASLGRETFMGDVNANH